MKLQVFCVYDKAVEAFMQPFFVRTIGEAIRSFRDACMDGKQTFCQHPEDFALMDLGTFDDSSGILTAWPEGPKLVMSALEAVKVVNPN